LGDELKLSKLGMLDVTVSGVPVFKAISGRAGERLAISIASVNKA
jgi:flagellar motor switch protein FliM